MELFHAKIFGLKLGHVITYPLSWIIELQIVSSETDGFWGLISQPVFNPVSWQIWRYKAYLQGFQKWYVGHTFGRS